MQDFQEYNGVRIYKYYFFGIDAPIEIEARNNISARIMMDKIYHSLPQQYRDSKISGETVTVPLIGISKKTENSIEYTWVGYKKSHNGWMETSKLQADIKSFSDKEKIIKLK